MPNPKKNQHKKQVDNSQCVTLNCPSRVFIDETMKMSIGKREHVNMATTSDRIAVIVVLLSASVGLVYFLTYRMANITIN